MSIIAQSREELTCMKEYTCLNFHLHCFPNPRWVKSVILSQTNQDHQRLPSVLIDSNSSPPLIYVLQWRQKELKNQLYIKRGDEIEWGLIELDCFPKKIFVTDCRVFLVGAEKMFILTLDQSQEILSIPLESGQIADARLAFNFKAESGVEMVYFDSRVGYSRRHYSRSTEVTLWQKVKSFCKLPFSKHMPYEHFKIIVPNILGVALRGNQLFFIDIFRMQPVLLSVSLLQVKDSSKIGIKWKIFPLEQQFSDAIDFYISREDHIQAFTLKLVRNQFKVEMKAEKGDEKVALDQFVEGDVINWSKAVVEKKADTIWTEGAVQDMQIFENRLIYRCFKDNQSEIPTLTLIDLHTMSKTSSIVSQEMQVWRSYLSGVYSGVLQDFAVAAYKLAENGEEKGKKWIDSSRDRKQDILGWKNNNYFYEFLIYGSRLYIARRGSLSRLSPIDKFQHEIQRYTEACMSQDQSKIVSEQQQQQESLRFLRYSVALANFQKEVQISYYKLILVDLKKNIESFQGYQCIQENDVDEIFRAGWVMSLLRDRICHFGQFMDYGFKMLSIKENSLKNQVISGMICGLRDIYADDRIRQQLKDSFMNLFASQVRIQMDSSDIFGLALLFRKIFENVLPDCYIKRTAKSVSSNKFFSFMIEIMLSNAQRQNTLICLQQLIKRYINTFESLFSVSEFGQLLLQNSSFFQAYLISHPPQQKLEAVLGVMLEDSRIEELILNLREIKDLISNQLQMLFQLKLKQSKRSLLKKSLGCFEEDKSLFTAVEGIKSFLSKEMLLYNSQQSFEKSHRSIQSLFQNWTDFSLKVVEEQIRLISELRSRQISLDLISQDYSHMLELEQSILVSYVRVFNARWWEIQRMSRNQLQEARGILLLLLECLQSSFENYCKYHKIFFRNGVQVKEETFFKQLQVVLCHQQKLMTSPVFASSIKIANFICSQISISVIRFIISRPELLNQAINRHILRIPDKLLEVVVKMVVENTDFKSSEVDMLYYMLMKKGQNYLRSVLQGCSSQKLEGFLAEVQKKRIHSSLMDAAGNSFGALSPGGYRNPFVSC